MGRVSPCSLLEYNDAWGGFKITNGYIETSALWFYNDGVGRFHTSRSGIRKTNHKDAKTRRSYRVILYLRAGNRTDAVGSTITFMV